MNFAEKNEIYWERQGSDLLCGVHCLNSLLQGPFFNEVDLGILGQELDQQEKRILQQAGIHSRDFLNFVASDSNNVAESGNYSIQVIQAALSQLQLRCLSISSNQLIRQELSNEIGFVCNQSNHWFALRKVNGIWYNLNSLSKLGPQSISDFYLSALLGQFQEQGSSIFLIQGKFPSAASFHNRDDLQQHQLLIDIKNIKAFNSQNEKKSDQSNKQKSQLEQFGDYLQEQTNAFKNYFDKMISAPSPIEQRQCASQYDRIQEMNRVSVVRESQNRQVQKQNDENIQLTIWISDNQKISQLFNPDMLVRDLYQLVAQIIKDQPDHFSIYTMDPYKRFLTQKSLTLTYANIYNKSILYVNRF